MKIALVSFLWVILNIFTSHFMLKKIMILIKSFKNPKDLNIVLVHYNLHVYNLDLKAIYMNY